MENRRVGPDGKNPVYLSRAGTRSGRRMVSGCDSVKAHACTGDVAEQAGEVITLKEWGGLDEFECCSAYDLRVEENLSSLSRINVIPVISGIQAK